MRNPTLDHLDPHRALDDGFTLVELLIVIVTLGILAAIVVFSLGSVTGNAKVSACNADAKTIQTAVYAYDANPPSNCTICVIGKETAGTAAGNITPGTASTYGTGTNAALLTANGFLNTWPSSSNGYSLSLSTSVAGDVTVYIGTATSGTSYEGETSATGCNAL
jgi:general secretion pathway protein G